VCTQRRLWNFTAGRPARCSHNAAWLVLADATQWLSAGGVVAIHGSFDDHEVLGINPRT